MEKTDIAKCPHCEGELQICESCLKPFKADENIHNHFRVCEG